MKEYTCTRCKGKFPSELLIQRTKTQRVCKKCNMEIEGLKELKSYICKIFDVKTVPGNILRQISKGYSEDFLCKTDAATIVLTRRKDVTERSL